MALRNIGSIALLAMITGCGGATMRPASVAIGTTTLTSASTESTLAPAAWEENEVPPAPTPATWGVDPSRPGFVSSQSSSAD